MDAKEKRKLEQKLQTDQRKDDIIDAAIQQFREKGIEKSTVADIAKRAEVGTMTVYRYFLTKAQLVIEAGLRMWQTETITALPVIRQKLTEPKNGLQQIRRMFSVFRVAFDEHADFLRFLEEFDNYIEQEKISPDDLGQYERFINDLKKLVSEAFEQGRADGSIRGDVDFSAFYMTTTHALISLGQKLQLRGNILRSDSDVGSGDQIDMLIDMAVRYIAANPDCP